jgi:hypothetical protein
MLDKIYAVALTLAGVSFGGYLLLNEAVPPQWHEFDWHATSPLD